MEWMSTSSNIRIKCDQMFSISGMNECNKNWLNEMLARWRAKLVGMYSYFFFLCALFFQLSIPFLVHSQNDFRYFITFSGGDLMKQNRKSECKWNELNEWANKQIYGQRFQNALWVPRVTLAPYRQYGFCF